jgi:hypothetical protein
VIVAAAVCPHPPLIVPDLAAGAAAELDGLRAACDRAVATLTAAGADALVTIGVDGPHYRDFRPWGVDVDVDPAGIAGGRPALPLSLLVGDWLLTRDRRATSGRAASDRMAVPDGTAVAACVAAGARLAADHRRLALLVLGDGSRCRGPKSPGFDDPRAEPYDRAVAAALADVDTAALLALDPALSSELGSAGRAPWQVLAGAVRATGGSWRGTLHYDDAPYGVAYLVATWTPA